MEILTTRMGFGRRVLIALLLVAVVVLAATARSLARAQEAPAGANPTEAGAAETVQDEAAQTPEEAEARGEGDVLVYRIPVTGVIEHGLAPFIERGLRSAERAGARAVILDMDTPGGYVDAAQRIVGALSDAAVPTYTYVNRHALSAGALIALSTDGIYMRPGSVIGAATPVTGDGETAPEKVVSVMRAEMRALAENRNLDPRIAEAMVDPEIEIDGVIDRGRLLTLTATDAIGLGYAQAASDWSDVLADLGFAGAATHTMEINWAERTVRFLTHPLVMPFLLTIGFLGLIFEVKSPGVGLPGLAGVTALALFFGSHFILGLAGWEHVIMLVVGLVLLIVEIFVVPGFTFFGLAGIVAILAAIYLSMIGQVATAVDYTRAAGVLSLAMMMTIVSAWALARVLPKSSRFMQTGILLGESTGRDTGYISVDVRPDLLGLEGIALTDLRPAGTAEFGDERVDVVSDAGWVPAGSIVMIVRSEGYRHVVRPKSRS